MVFESIVTELLNRFLGDYVEDLNQSQLRIGIWGGKRNGKVVFVSYCHNYL
jgi:vacuolar protein sorting-associated protein 13A/C